mmetsp:Transcript_78372/g.127120  ORF Transcript_78372/g.127120 Transcript_78372/m.127120 type:complete len:283 (-) Transcript_78372:192-1040(-)
MMAAANSKVREAASTAGTVRLLVKMVSNARKGIDWSDVQAAAAEAIWSLIYSNHANHAEAVRRGSVSAMLNLAKTSHNELTRMWSMACLSHLAEDFCESSTGECPWVQVSFAARGVEPDRRGHSDNNARVTVDSSPVRLAMYTQGVIALAVVLAAKRSSVCPDFLRPPIGALANEEGLVAWAAAAVLKSLAFSHVLHAPLVKGGAVAVLGKLATSTCTLEAETADMALKRLMAVGVTRDSFVQDDLDSIATWQAWRASATAAAAAQALYRDTPHGAQHATEL